MYALHRHRDLTGLSLGQAEVHHVRLVIAIHDDVGRLQISVDDTCFMSMMQRLSEFHAEFRSRSRCELLPD